MVNSLMFGVTCGGCLSAGQTMRQYEDCWYGLRAREQVEFQGLVKDSCQVVKSPHMESIVFPLLLLPVLSAKVKDDIKYCFELKG